MEGVFQQELTKVMDEDLMSEELMDDENEICK